MKELAAMIADLERLHEADLDNWERGFVRNIVILTAMDRATGNRLNLSSNRVEAIERVWKKHFG